MRQGTNPAKLDYALPGFNRHRVIVPVFVPHHEDYFRHAREVLRLSLESLIRTTRGRAAITVIANGCTPEVIALLRRYFDDGAIDQIVWNDHNWGKIDAALTAIHGRFEELLTVADHDVLYLPGWLEAVEEIFLAFPEAGFVTPAPNPSLAFLHTTATILSAALRLELREEPVVPGRDLDLFAKSIGRPDLFTADHRRAQLVVKRHGVTACVGGGHFVFTLRRDVVERLPHDPVLAALGSGMTDRFDDPPDAVGVWRLSTTRAYARHMGNVPEPWMYDELTAPMPALPAIGARRPLPHLRLSSVRHIPLGRRKRMVAAFRRLGFRPGGRRFWRQVAPAPGGAN